VDCQKGHLRAHDFSKSTNGFVCSINLRCNPKGTYSMLFKNYYDMFICKYEY
jgi:hypothetical protein